MEPPKPKRLEMVRSKGLEQEHAEFEKLLSARFEIDPSVAQPASLTAGKQEDRLRELGRRLAQKLKED